MGHVTNTLSFISNDFWFVLVLKFKTEVICASWPRSSFKNEIFEAWPEHCKDLFSSCSPLSWGIAHCQSKTGQIHQESPLPLGKPDTSSCLAVPSGCQKCYLVSQLFSLESAKVPWQKMASDTKLTPQGLCPSPCPGLVVFHCLSSLMPSNICLTVYAALLIVVRNRPQYLDFVLWKQ